MSDNRTIRVLDANGNQICTYGWEFYAGHVKAVIETLNAGYVVQEREDDGTWSEVTESAIP